MKVTKLSKIVDNILYFNRDMWLSRSQTTSALEEAVREAKEADEKGKKSNAHFKKKLPKDAEASNILVGEVMDWESFYLWPRWTSLTSQLLPLFVCPSLCLWATSPKSLCKQGFCRNKGENWIFWSQVSVHIARAGRESAKLPRGWESNGEQLCRRGRPSKWITFDICNMLIKTNIHKSLQLAQFQRTLTRDLWIIAGVPRGRLQSSQQRSSCCWARWVLGPGDQQIYKIRNGINYKCKWLL